jgi:hypothetical protein
MITLKRAYDPMSRSDGPRFLVERLWPRGLTKAQLQVDAWLKEAGPSTELRKWFGHDPEKWDASMRTFSTANVRPLHPERICWGCEEHCPADALGCGNETVRAMHPAELFGDDWLEWSEHRTAADSEGASPESGARVPGDRP